MKSVGLPSLRQEREGQRHRIVGNVAAADVEGPGDGIGQAQHRGVGLLLGNGLLQPGDLVGGGLAGEFDRVQRHRAQRRRRPVGPQAVERIVVDRHERGIGRLAGLGEAAHLG